jgi:hypothetical protein
MKCAAAAAIFSERFTIHFGQGKAEKVDLLEIRRHSGLVEILRDLKANELIT